MAELLCVKRGKRKIEINISWAHESSIKKATREIITQPRGLNVENVYCLPHFPIERFRFPRSMLIFNQSFQSKCHTIKFDVLPLKTKNETSFFSYNHLVTQFRFTLQICNEKS